MSGTTNSLLQIADSLKDNKPEEARSILEGLKEKYRGTVNELYTNEEIKNRVFEELGKIFDDIETYFSTPYLPQFEKEIVAQGEMMSTLLFYNYLKELNKNVVLLNALDFMKIDEKEEPDFNYIEEHLNSLLKSNQDCNLFITQGFICKNNEGKTDNLKRGGSDYTASIIGAVINADEIDIWTDIDGMHNNDPRFVDKTFPVHNLHFDEAAELAYFGAKILHPTCILPAKKKNVPVFLLNTMEPEAKGTLINNELIPGTIKAIAAKDDITAIKIKSSRMLLAYGFLKKVFEVFEKNKTSIDMITTSEVGVSVTVDNPSHLKEIIEELKEFGDVTVDRDMVIICVVGDLKWENKGLEAKALDAINNLPVRMISYGGSNYNISFLIRKEDKVKALQLLNDYLF